MLHLISAFAATDAQNGSEHFLRRVERLCLALPLILLVLLLAGIGSAHAAVPAACRADNLLAQLQADGRLAAVEAEAAKVANGDGKLFRIEKPGVAPSFLLGTMHLADSRVLALSPQADAALQSARRLVVETTDVLEPAKAAAAFFAHPELINLPRGQTLADLLSDEEEERVKGALTARGMPFQAVHTLQPWFLSISLMLPACEMAHRADGAAVLDAALARRAQAAGKPVEGLESSAEQLTALASLPMDLQVEGLVATVDLAAHLPDVMEMMVSLYVDGRIAMILPTIEAAIPNGAVLVGAGEGYAEFERRIVTDRNRRMAERMQPMLAAGGTFVAVGALHLPGDTGIVALLRNQGWTVTRAD
ncbi:TraB/GumN family protein [Aurantimonas sp. A2-1-M11]|uniref:TraB/GumN family protein n=1 Tax=Aurantimonas sp. A2-1-M11 TaxID=3113712 RepID=UPI002F949972